ncbi:MAG: 4Fe-4S binding protein [Acidobacteriota bacterium]
MSTTHSPALTTLRQVGLTLFLVAFALFAALPFVGDYQLTDEVLASLPERGVGNETFLNELQALKGREYGSVHAFVGDVQRKIEEADEAGANVGEWNVTPYTTTVVRAVERGPATGGETLWFWLTFGLGSLGAALYFLPRMALETPGIKNDGIWFSSMKARGWLGIATGVFFTAFYIVLYFAPYYITSWIRLADPVSHFLRNTPADRWFFYGLMYTFCVGVMAIRFAMAYRHSRYQLVRNASVVFFQLGFAFLIPAILVALNRPSYDFKLAWPLDYGFFADYNVDALTSAGLYGWVVLFWGIALAFLVVPALAAFWGKRWYCSWVCGCGALAETLGDPYRQLSDKSLKAWRWERWIVHGVLVAAVAMTALVTAEYWTSLDESAILGGNSWKVREWYGFLIGAWFAGVVGVGFYPFMGSRVWCRFGCPLAAILGLVQRFKSRFRITTNGGQCISCGNCSTYCEMGIDVRWYAQRGQDVVRSSCVGCGICSQVCPRGVLRLENGPMSSRVLEARDIDIARGHIEVG